MNEFLLFADSPPPTTSIHAFYSANLRTPLFAGFLTTASFMLTATTFMILNLKKEIIENEAYQSVVKTARAFSNKREIKHTGPLGRILKWLLGTVVAALVTSFSQVSLGLFESNFAAVTCLVLAGMTFVALAGSLVIVWCNLSTMILFWEVAAEKRERIAAAKALESAAVEDVFKRLSDSSLKPPYGRPLPTAETK